MEIVRANKANKWGLAGVLFCATVIAMPFRHPWCLLWPLGLAAAASCGIVAAIRGNKYWMILAVIAGLFAAQSVLAVMVEC